MRKVFIESSNIITSVGFSTAENVNSILEKRSGIRINQPGDISRVPVPLSLVDRTLLDKHFERSASPDDHTLFEKLALTSLSLAIEKSNIPVDSEDTLFILSTTKGNIDLLERRNQDKFPKERLSLWDSAFLIRDFFGMANEPVLICNACISGVLAINTARILLQTGRYKHAVITGADILSRFVVAGFQSFQSLSPGPCRPFDSSRDGLTLGEGSGTIILTTDPTLIEENSRISVVAGASSNDANHISGPSRTGEGLFHAVRKTLEEVGMLPENIDFLSAHGTATDYNDEMEAKAFDRCGLSSVPVNSFKGCFGHTLGAAGVIESVLTVESMRRNILMPSIGYENHGVSIPLRIPKTQETAQINHALKTASGFGGCNAAVLFRKDN
ncbi:MAG: beta-ketoacyl synthase [Bacteroidetes bacterium]|nr:beta-ketoacyl synthase [Bacteroidota bacterium]